MKLIRSRARFIGVSYTLNVEVSDEKRVLRIAVRMFCDCGANFRQFYLLLWKNFVLQVRQYSTGRNSSVFNMLIEFNRYAAQ